MVPGDGLYYEVSIVLGAIIGEYVASVGGESAAVCYTVVLAEADG